MTSRSIRQQLACARSMVAFTCLLVASPASAQSQPEPPASGAPAPADSDMSARAAADRKAGDEAMEALRYTDALASYVGSTRSLMTARRMGGLAVVA